MKDQFGRTINYLRVSVTDRCNLRCAYCTSAGPAPVTAPERLLTFEEIREVVHVAATLGITKVRLTGGEPLLRPDLAALVALLAAIRGIDELALTTNGVLLAEQATGLARAGLGRVNVHLDTLDPDRYRAITGRDELGRVLAGIAAAQAAGLVPVKLNCVVERDGEEPDARTVGQYAQGHGLEVRYIRRMDRRTGQFATFRGGHGGDCRHCNRLRLTCDGLVMPCLFADLAFSVRELGARGALARALQTKPAAGGVCREHQMSRIGG